MELAQKLREFSQTNKEAKPWKGTFAAFLDLVETGKYPNVGVNAHKRIYDMIMSGGTEEVSYFGKKRIKYKFLEDQLFGIERSIDKIMEFIHAAAHQDETSKRMLLLWGPPGTGKSQLVTTLKRGLEAYSRTDAGAVFALSGCKMHENPFYLVPDELRPEFQAKYGIEITGHLNPANAWRLQEEFSGDFMKFPIERIFIQESTRTCIGSFLPGDTKSQDQSELIGSIDYAKIQEYGIESHPAAFSFDGEINVANRGLMDFVEGMKADEKFLRVLLTATQEKKIKTPRFGMIDCDEFIILHTNETEFRSFMNEPKYEAYRDRMVIINLTHVLAVKDEVKLYRKLLDASNYNKDVHIAPHTIDAAAMFAVLSRIEEPEGKDLSLVKKMKLYNNEHVKGYKEEDVPQLFSRFPNEGNDGMSPRFMIDMLNTSITKAANKNQNFITGLDVLKQIHDGVLNRDVFTKEQKNKYKEMVQLAREEWDDLLLSDIQKAFFSSFEEESRALCENYLDAIDSVSTGSRPRDAITGQEKEIDEKLMRSIEDNIGVSSSGREDFRNEILRMFASAARKGKKFDYTEHTQLREGIEKHMFSERKGYIRTTVATRNPEPEAERRLNTVIDRMVEQYGYTVDSAKEILKYATAHLFDK